MAEGVGGAVIVEPSYNGFRYTGMTTVRKTEDHQIIRKGDPFVL